MPILRGSSNEIRTMPGAELVGHAGFTVGPTGQMPTVQACVSWAQPAATKQIKVPLLVLKRELRLQEKTPLMVTLLKPVALWR